MLANDSRFSTTLTCLVLLMLFSLVIIGYFLVMGINNYFSNIQQSDNTLKQLEFRINSLNNTQNIIINYINDRNEPFIDSVAKYANNTNLRLDKLENKK